MNDTNACIQWINNVSYVTWLNYLKLCYTRPTEKNLWIKYMRECEDAMQLYKEEE